MKSINIGSVKIGEDSPPYIIAELSGNHNNNIDRAIKLIKVAKECGASAVKLQTFTPECLTLNNDSESFKIKGGTWDGLKLYDLYQKTQTPYHWHETLFRIARDIEITLFSSPFSIQAVEFLSKFNPPAYKIASNELHDWPLVKEIAHRNKPIIISTGVATMHELEKTIDLIRGYKNSQIIILHCISAYPAKSEDANIKTIPLLRDKFNTIVGFSDHTLDDVASCAAIANGANVIEKHITLDRMDGGPDSSFSVEPNELNDFIKKCNDTWKSLGEQHFATRSHLKKNAIYLRQLWTTENISKGEKIGWHNVKSIRGPSESGGSSTMDYERIIGRDAKCAIPIHSPIIYEDMIEVGNVKT